MTTPIVYVPDPALDLVLERTVDVSPALVWKAWTTPQHLMQWFCPLPWTTVACELDVRPGGIFRTVMQSPEGERYPNVGCFLEVVDGRQLAWTDAMGPGFRPVVSKDPTAAMEGAGPFTAVIRIEPHGTGTHYVAMAIHATEARRRAHEAMGFHQGWGTAFDQLVAMARTMTP